MNYIKITNRVIWQSILQNRSSVQSKIRFYGSQNKLSDLYHHKDPSLKDPKVVVFGQRVKKEDEVVETEVGVIIPKENVRELLKVQKNFVDGRTARIFKRPKNSMQQGTDNTKDWLLEFNNTQKWENSLLGWCSSGDPMSNTSLQFPSKCAAVCFAERQGWKWAVEEEPVKPSQPRPKNYSDNFSWNRRTRVSTK